MLSAQAVTAESEDNVEVQAVADSANVAIDAWRTAVRAAADHDFESAVANVDVAVKAGLNDSKAFQHRGRWNFQAGNVAESLRDFDRFVKLAPQQSIALWERGITCYYTGDFVAGAQQFVDYQKYHDNDVENAVWRYLCQMKVDGKQKSRAAILPIKHDRRVPMMEIYRLFRGESTPQNVLDVLNAAQTSGSAPDERSRQQTFDAHLYLALYFDSEDDLPSARKHIDVAVKQFKKGHYMWSVAVQHQKHLLEQAKQKLSVKQNVE